jgi:hypothetical protein
VASPGLSGRRVDEAAVFAIRIGFADCSIHRGDVFTPCPNIASAGRRWRVGGVVLCEPEPRCIPVSIFAEMMLAHYGDFQSKGLDGF